MNPKRIQWLGLAVLAAGIGFLSVAAALIAVGLGLLIFGALEEAGS